MNTTLGMRKPLSFEESEYTAVMHGPKMPSWTPETGYLPLRSSLLRLFILASGRAILLRAPVLHSAGNDLVEPDL